MSFQLSFYTLYFFASCQAPHLGGSTLSPRLKCIHVANCIAHSMLYYEGISSPFYYTTACARMHTVLITTICCLVQMSSYRLARTTLTLTAVAPSFGRGLKFEFECGKFILVLSRILSLWRKIQKLMVGVGPMSIACNIVAVLRCQST